jgi:hypothetical protein
MMVAIHTLVWSLALLHGFANHWRVTSYALEVGDSRSYFRAFSHPSGETSTLVFVVQVARYEWPNWALTFEQCDGFLQVVTMMGLGLSLDYR